MNCIQYVSRINEFLPLGCLELDPNGHSLRYRMGQAFHPNTDPKIILDFFVEQQNSLFPKLVEGLNNVIQLGKNPIECAQTFIKPFNSPQKDQAGENEV